MLIASDNPLLMVSMAQLAAPPLKDLRLALDGKPVAVPTGAVPLPQLPVCGRQRERAGPRRRPGGGSQPATVSRRRRHRRWQGLLHMRITGAFTASTAICSATSWTRARGEHSELIELQRQMYQRYRDWMVYTDVRLALGPQWPGFAPDHALQSAQGT